MIDMPMPADDLVKLLSLSAFDPLNHMTSNRVTITCAIVTYFFEVTIFEPLLNLEEMHKAQSRHRSQSPVPEGRPLVCEPPDAGATSGIVEMRCQNPTSIGIEAPRKHRQTFNGSVSFDLAKLSGVGKEILPAVSLKFNFLGSKYAVNDTAFDWQPEVVFLNGTFLGISFMSEDFSFVEGLSAQEESYFIYDLDLGSGAGDVNYYLLFPSVSTISSCLN